MSPISFLFDRGIKPTSLSRPSLTFIVAAILHVLYIISSAIYNVYFHPLRRIPRLKTWIVFFFFYHLAAIRGVLDKKLRSFHGKIAKSSGSHLKWFLLLLRKPGKISTVTAMNSCRSAPSQRRTSNQTSSLQTTQIIHTSESIVSRLISKRSERSRTIDEGLH